MSEINASVKDYYGKTLQSSDDLQTSACCTLEEPPKYIKQALANIHDEVMAKYYGCGLTVPDQLEGLTVLDLGSGSGRDVYVLSQFVGEQGRVIGVDMTDEQLNVANSHISYHREKFGYRTSNVTFLKGNIEHLDELDIEEGSIDIIVSNCVINLVEDKEKVLATVYKLLKPGGEMYFSDVYTDRRVPKMLQEDTLLWGECLSGALYWNDFLKMSKRVGFTDPRSMKSNSITIENEDIKEKVGDLKFFSVTYRLWKLDGLEEDCEDYGQAVMYKGTIKHAEHSLQLDDHHVFPKGKVMSVCGNTYKMLHDTRYKGHFEFYGSWDTHYGIFEGCGGSMPFSLDSDGGDSGACC